MKGSRRIKIPFVWLLTTLLLCLPLATATAQKTIVVKAKNEPLTSVLRKIEKTTDYKFMYSNAQLDKYRVTKDIQSKDIHTVMQLLMEELPLTFTVKDKFVYIVPTKDAAPQREQASSARMVTGQVVDNKGRPLYGVTVKTDVPDVYGITGEDGRYAILVPEGRQVQSVTFSFMGMTEQTVPYRGRPLNITMQDNTEELGEVVVNGMFTRRAESFTGASATFKKDELIEAGNQNLLKSLGKLDPSFQVFENLQMGSDPNTLPSVQLRGQSSFPNLQGDYEGNPNQPLFILDGFETTIEKVFALDMNRVQSVTILKDAAAKAIYGSKAGNGVVVIETEKPKSGELKLYYNGSLDLEIPDLTGYNLMNAEEKLQFEKERNFYDFNRNLETAERLSALYEQIRADVLAGVDTYWLAQPIRTGVGHKHSAIIEGGDARMRYQAGASYNDIRGVMKGSDRQTLNLNSTLSYSYKSLIFRNTLEYTKNTADNSPYGSFADYAKLAPYWRPTDAAGHYLMVLGTDAAGKTVYNPLYNATLNTKSQTGYDEVRENFSAEWRVNADWRLTARLTYTHQNRTSDEFYPASHTRFANYDAQGLSDRKGLYTKGNGKYDQLSADAGVNFNKTLGQHFLFLNGTWNIADVRSQFSTVSAEGFANDRMDDFNFGTQYQTGTRPTGTDYHTREVGLIGALNYSFADRYLFDASLRANGSSLYGSNKRWGTFWSVGAGWNLHNEAFLKDNPLVKRLKLRTSLGYTGTQNFNPYQAMARYTYTSVVYENGLGAQLIGLPNPDLQWQRVKDWNIGTDVTLKQWLNLTFDYYVSTTDDLLSNITVAPSLGFSSYKENMGKIENRGYDLTVAVTPWRDNEQRGWLTLTFGALHNKSKIKEIGDIFKHYNESETNADKPSGSVYTLYYEGMSMTAIWGMQSLGIDPASGKEWFLRKDGTSTDTWSSSDLQVIGDTNPTLRGNFGISGGYRGFTFGLSCQYKFGGDLYNSTLVDKVENINGLDNVDRRVADSWKAVGDVALYKQVSVRGGAAGNGSTVTRTTSRFVQSDNELYISQVNVGYELYNNPLLQRIGLSRLSLTCYLNELARLSSIKVERGTQYPFARTLSLALRATF